MKTLMNIIKAALTKFSVINLVHYATIATLIIQMWVDADLMTAAVALILNGLFTMLLKWQQSTKELVATGFNMNWMVYVMGLIGIAAGVFDMWIAEGDGFETLLGEWARPVMMIYIAVSVIIRTGFTNQSHDSIRTRKGY